MNNLIIKSLLQKFKEQLYPISLYSRQIVGTIVLFIIARYLPVYDYGLFSSYKNIAAFLLMFANLGFSDYILVSSKANVHEVKIKMAFFLINAISIVMAIIFLSLFCRIENHLLFSLIVLRTFFDGIFFALIIPYFQASKKFTTIAIINIIYSIGVAIIAIVSYLFKLSLLKFLILCIALGFVNFIQCTYYVKINYFNIIFKLNKVIAKLNKKIFDYIIVCIAGYMYVQFSSLYVAMLLSKEDVALYFSAYTIVTIISLIYGAQIQKMMPYIINTSVQDAKKVIKENTIIILSITIGIFIFLVFLGRYILKLIYGNEYYTNAYPVLLILAFGTIILAIGSMFGAYITASGHQRKKLPMQIQSFIVLIVSLFFLRQYGIYGAAWSYLITSLYASLLFTLYGIKLLKSTNKGG